MSPIWSSRNLFEKFRSLAPAAHPRADTLKVVQRKDGQTNYVTDRWTGLVRDDDEIRAAAEQLRPFGERWVNKLGQTFLALNEDRTYLPNIVRRLVQEAIADTTQRWTARFRQTANGERCTEESLHILRQAEAQGYTLAVEKNKLFSVTKKGGSIWYLRSNSDIRSFSQQFLREQGIVNEQRAND